jgi:hypothetical protein
LVWLGGGGTDIYIIFIDFSSKKIQQGEMLVAYLAGVHVPPQTINSESLESALPDDRASPCSQTKKLQHIENLILGCLHPVACIRSGSRVSV